MTIWRDIKGYESIYQVSDTGLVRSLDRTVWNKGVGVMQNLKGKILKPKVHTTGYYEVMLYNQYRKTKMHRVHRLVAENFLDNPQDKKIVNHKDGIKTNNNVSNLEWCTSIENAHHAINTGLKKFGDYTNSSKLTEELVIKARKEFLTGKYTCYQIARKYKIGFNAMARAIRGDSWFYVTGVVVTEEDWERLNKKKKLKVTDEMIFEIKERVENGEKLTILLKEYQIGKTTYYGNLKKKAL